jgi:hypothetical protein
MLDLATVTFHDELPLLDLQAKSFHNIGPDVVNSIYVLVNDIRFDECAHHIEKVSKPLYGTHAHRVRVVSPAALGATGRIGGWITQQAMKLAVSRIATSDHIVILDSKNHFVHPTALEVFFDAEGRPKTTVRVHEPGSMMRLWLDHSLDFFGLGHLGDLPAPPASTPYPARREDLLGAVAEIEARSGCGLFEYFGSKPDQATEFFLLYGYLLSRYGHIERAVSISHEVPACFYWKAPTGPRREEFIRAAEEGRSHTFGVHRERFRQLADWEKRRIVALWARAGMFASEGEAASYMTVLVERYNPSAS